MTIYLRIPTPFSKFGWTMLFAFLNPLGPGSSMAKTDLKSAFRLIPIHPDDWDLLRIHWNNQYYVNLYLPFGLRSAPFLFNQLSDALEWVLKHNYGLKHVLHILDDFFIAEPTRLKCLSSFNTLLRFFYVGSCSGGRVQNPRPLPSTRIYGHGIRFYTHGGTPSWR